MKKAEILLALKLVSSNYSYNSCSDIVNACKTAFVDSKIAIHMELGSTKVCYLIANGIAPYFLYFLKDLGAGSGYFTIYFDETTTWQVKKQKDIHIAYWSASFKKAIVLYINSTFLGHADADTIKDEIVTLFENQNLDGHNLLQYSMDGPTVNLSFIRKLNKSFALKKIPAVIDLGTCSIHPVHTAFTRGLSTLKFNVEQFANDIYFWFKLSAAHREDYAEVQCAELLEVPSQFFVRQVASHWLSLGVKCQRLVKQFPAISTYFLKTLPESKNKTACVGNQYKRIKDTLANKATIVYLHFVSFLAASLTDFVKLFQSCSSLVHILYDKLNGLLRSVMFKFLKFDLVQGKDGSDLVDLKCDQADNWLPLKEMDIGMGTRLAISKVKHSIRTELRHEFRQCFKIIAIYMQTRLPLANPVLRDLSCLQPKNRKVDKSKSAISRLCLHMKKVTKTDDVCDE